MFKFLNFFLIVFSLLSSKMIYASSYKGGAETLNPKAYSIDLSASVFQTTGHWDIDGNEVAMNEGASFKMIDTDLKISYGINANIETSVSAKFRMVNSNDGTTDVSNSGPESAGVEVKYSFPQQKNIRYAVGLRFRQSLFSNTKYTPAQVMPTDQVALGDDGSEYGVNFYATYMADPLKWDGMIGYTVPPNDLSSEVVYRVQGMYRFEKLGLFAGVEGIHSLKRDQFTDTPLEKPRMSTGQSYLFNSINREVVTPFIGANYAFEKVLLTLTGKTTATGRSTDKGTTGVIALNFGSDGVTPESVKIESFKEYTIEGSVLKVSARGNFVKIDQGLSTDVEKGMRFDIYQTDYFGGNVLVGSGVAYQVGADWSVIKLTKKYKEIEIKPGFAARGY